MEQITHWPTGTEIAYYVICPRKMWFFTRGIQMEGESDRVAEGRNIHNFSYPDRRAGFREWEQGPIKLDYFNPRIKMVHEIKLSKKMEKAHDTQVLYYLFYLKNHGFGEVKAILEYPLLKDRKTLELETVTEEFLMSIIQSINQLKQDRNAPALSVKKSVCKSCAYFELCYAGEEEFPEEAPDE